MPKTSSFLVAILLAITIFPAAVYGLHTLTGWHVILSIIALALAVELSDYFQLAALVLAIYGLYQFTFVVW